MLDTSDVIILTTQPKQLQHNHSTYVTRRLAQSTAQQKPKKIVWLFIGQRTGFKTSRYNRLQHQLQPSIVDLRAHNNTVEYSQWSRMVDTYTIVTEPSNISNAASQNNSNTQKKKKKYQWNLTKTT